MVMKISETHVAATRLLLSQFPTVIYLYVTSKRKIAEINLKRATLNSQFLKNIEVILTEYKSYDIKKRWHVLCLHDLTLVKWGLNWILRTLWGGVPGL